MGNIGTLRTQIEADLLLQNLMLVADAMGLGAYIHSSISPPVLLGDPKFTGQYGKMLGFDFVPPPFNLLDLLRWQVLLPKFANLRAHPVGLTVGGEHLIKAKCPPYYPSMSAAVDDVWRALTPQLRDGVADRSNLVGRTTGRSAGFAPFKIRPM